jgi:hypothetical protein
MTLDCQHKIGPPLLSLEAADEPFGISNSKSQTGKLKFATWDFGFRASLGQGLSAAAGRLDLGVFPFMLSPSKHS